MKSLFLSVVAFLCLLPCAWSQTSAGTVSGTVRDQSGAVIPGAAVALFNSATNVTSQNKTNDAGVYIFPGLQPGTYRLSAESAGMQKYEAEVLVQVGQRASIDPVMQPAGTATSVEIVDVTPLVTTDNATVATTLEHTRIEQLPLNGRSVVTLLNNLPGMENSRAYGTRAGSLEYVLDGAQEADRRWTNAPRSAWKRCRNSAWT